MWMSTVIFSCRFFFPLSFFFFFFVLLLEPRRIYRSPATFSLWSQGPLELLQTGSSSRECQSIMRLVQEGAHAAAAAAAAAATYRTAARVTRGGKKKIHVLSFCCSERVLLFHMCLLSVGWFFFICSVFFYFYLFLHECMLLGFPWANYVGQSASSSSPSSSFFLKSTSTCQRFCAGLLAFLMSLYVC